MLVFLYDRIREQTVGLTLGFHQLSMFFDLCLVIRVNLVDQSKFVELPQPLKYIT